MRKDWFDRHIDDRRKEARRIERKEGYPNSYRLLCNGVVIDECNKKFGREFCLRQLGYFKTAIESALSNPDYVFEGVATMKAHDYLQWQSERLNVAEFTNLEIVEPGKSFPVCTGKLKG